MRTISWIENIRKQCRLRHVVVWIGGDEDEAEHWSKQNSAKVAIIPSDSPDLTAWNIDPRHECSVVFIERNMAIGGLANIGRRTEIDFRLRVMALGEKALDMKHGHARMWGRAVTRQLVIESTPDERSADEPAPMGSDLKPNPKKL